MKYPTINWPQVEIPADWRKMVAKYQSPEAGRSLWQLANSLIPYILLWAVMYWSLSISYWLTLLLAVPAAGFLVRLFIIFHDCGHGSFFRSQKASDVVGFITGVLTFTPYYQWRHDHALHHATAGDLDRRGVGDVMTLTVKEYLAAPWWKKAGYRIMRSPWILFTVGATLNFVIFQRFSHRSGGKRETMSVVWTNLALAGLITGLSLLVGFKEYVMIQLPITMLSCSLGVWLFYVQHNYDGTYWVRHEQWDFALAGFNGSSFYKLPRLLNWFTGNIGFHHIHHLSPKIPNYKLEQCHRENPALQVPPLTIMRSLKSLWYRFWDEDMRRMVGIEALRRFQRSSMQQ